MAIADAALLRTLLFLVLICSSPCVRTSAAGGECSWLEDAAVRLVATRDPLLTLDMRSGQDDSAEATALVHELQHNDIYSNSWGPSDDGATLERPGDTP